MSWGGLGVSQRKWVLKRDGYRCQHETYEDVMGGWEQCEETTDLHVHHIHPRRWMSQHYPWVDPNRPHNLITLCKNHHMGEDGVHPEMSRALEEYRSGDKLAFNSMSQMHRHMAEHGEGYWDTKHDLQYVKRAKTQTTKFKEKFPEMRRKRGWRRPRR